MPSENKRQLAPSAKIAFRLNELYWEIVWPELVESDAEDDLDEETQ